MRAAVPLYHEPVRDPRHYFDLNAEDPPPVLDPAELARLEGVLGVRLPAALVELLNVRNGGELRLSRFRHPAGGSYSIHDLAGVAGGRGGAGDLFRVPYLRGEWGVPEWAVMLSGDGHTWIALDYRVSEEPPVVYLEEGRDGFDVVELAPSFAAFLDGLEVDTSRTIWGSPEPTAVVLNSIRTRYDVRLSDRFEAAVFAEQGGATGRVHLHSNHGRRDELVWPEVPHIRSILECDIDAPQRAEAARWMAELGISLELVHEP